MSKHPTELTAAPYIQTLYANQSVFDCLILSKFKLSDKYLTSNLRQVPPATDKCDYWQYYTALKTKPFIILAGISGSGKSRIVRTLAYQFCSKELQEKSCPGNFKIIKVKPNWHDSSELIGYESHINGRKYIISDFLRFVVKAHKHSDVPFFLLLDEMNLAPVEQYFAEYLSVLESRRLDDADNFVADALVNRDQISSHNDDQLWKDLGLTELSPGTDDSNLRDMLLCEGITLPQNLFVMGTVNIDETTHSFSRKVLDRAMTIEMNDVDLHAGLEAPTGHWDYPPAPLDAEVLFSHRLDGYHACQSISGDLKKGILDYLDKLNSDEILGTSRFKLGYRTRDEFLIYASHAAESGLELCKILDKMTIMKVLCRIEGDDCVGPVLKALKKVCEEQDLIDSLAKVKEMINKLDSGYTSFWN